MIQMVKDWILALSRKIYVKTSSSPTSLSHEDSHEPTSPNENFQKCYRCGGSGVVMLSRIINVGRYDGYSYEPPLFEEQCYICIGAGYIYEN